MSEQLDSLRELLKANQAESAPHIIKLSRTHYEWTIGIGDDHYASIIMDRDAFLELMQGQELPENMRDEMKGSEI